MMAKVTNKGQFKPGNKAAVKPHRCPYCQKEITIRNYITITKKIEPSRLKTDTKGIENE